MSEVIVDTLKHSGNSGTANITLASGGGVTVPDTLTVPTKKLVCPGTVIQVLQAFKSDSYTRTSDSTSTTIPGLEQAITMTSASNKVLVMAQVQATCGSSYGGHVLNLVRGSTKISQATDAGSRTVGTVALQPHDDYPGSLVFNYLDTPGAGTHTYAVQDMDPDSSNAIYVNRTINDSNNTAKQRTTSSLILMEVVA